MCLLPFLRFFIKSLIVIFNIQHISHIIFSSLASTREESVMNTNTFDCRKKCYTIAIAITQVGNKETMIVAMNVTDSGCTILFCTVICDVSAVRTPPSVISSRGVTSIVILSTPFPWPAPPPRKSRSRPTAG